MNGAQSNTPDLNERDRTPFSRSGLRTPQAIFSPVRLTKGSYRWCGQVSPSFLTGAEQIKHWKVSTVETVPVWISRICPAIVRLDDLAEMDLILTWRRIMNG